MQNALNIFIATILMAGTAYAQETSKETQMTLDELFDFIEAPLAKVEKQSQAPVAATVLTDAQPAEEVNVDALVEQSREAFIGGEFVKAQQGFATAVKLDPENAMACMYLRTLLERDQRTAEIEGIDAVNAAWSTDLVLRPYPLAQDAREKMDLGATSGAVDVQALFPQVAFPEGSQAIYQPKMEILFVRNTAENLAVLEAILDATGVLKDSGDVEQVEIEAKFVEVSEGTLEELGFQWNWDDPNSIGLGGANLEVSDGPGGLFSDALRGSAGAPLPFNRRGEMGDGSLAASGDWSTFRFEDNFSESSDGIEISRDSHHPFDLMISALDQSSGSDLLSAPRVVTQSGEEATIRAGERHYFPEVFEGDSSQATMLYISYEDFEERMLGVEMSVTPEVDGDQIQLSLKPTITELIGWQSYKMANADTIYNTRQTSKVDSYRHPAVIARLPVFKKREIETEVVINNGGTIGMGGLISEKVEAFEDSVPVLGSIPFVGRLFRNEGERVVKRNLLMFVTAQKVAPSGRTDTPRSFE